jgi:ADP-heptose:LPS heptosyltransferase
MKIRVWFIKIHYVLLNVFLQASGRILYQKPLPTARKVLIVRKGNMDDIVCSLPAFEAIRVFFSEAQLDLLTTHGSQSNIGAGGFLPSHYFNKIYEYRDMPLKDLYNTFRFNAYDAVIELPADVDTFWTQFRNLLFFKLTGIRQGGGWTITRTRFAYRTQIKNLFFDSEQKRLQAILQRYGIVTPNNYPRLFTPDDQTRVGERVTLPPSGKWVAIAVGAKLDKKKWPILYFTQVVNWLQQQGFSVIAVGDSNDYEVVASMQNASIYNTCGKLSIAESAALLSMCDLTICNDSGPMHVSYTVGTPVIAIFSARNYPGKWFPPDDGKNKVLVSFDVPCAGCMNAPCANNICMQQITPEQVISFIQPNLQV